MVADGGTVSKRYAASVLWPESNMQRARDCLYKTIAWLRRRPELLRLFGLEVVREDIAIRPGGLPTDLEEFDRCYARRGDPDCCLRAAELYSGPLFWQDCYDWGMEAQSRYEVRYTELLSTLVDHRCHSGPVAEAKHQKEEEGGNECLCAN